MPRQSVILSLFGNLKISRKLMIGFGLMILFIIATALTGFDGIRKMDHSLFVVGDKTVPVVDMANEMKISLLASLNAMEEFKSASSALATDDESAISDIEEKYKQSVKDFDKYASAILDGARLESGVEVIKTDDVELATMIKKADTVHNEKFQKSAIEMMEEGKNLLKKKTHRRQSLDRHGIGLQ